MNKKKTKKKKSVIKEEIKKEELKKETELAVNVQDEILSVKSDGPKVEVSTDGVNDNMSLVYYIVILHGIGVLIPWNIFVTAKEYFVDYKLSDHSENTSLSSNGTTKNKYQTDFMSETVVAANVPSVLFSAINLFVTSKEIEILRKRIYQMVSVEIFVCILTEIMIFVDFHESMGLFYHLTMLTVILMCMANGMYQSSLFAIVGILPANYSNALIFGNNICGVFVSIISIISKATTPNPKFSAAVYFGIAILILVTCFKTIKLMLESEFYKHYQLASTSNAQTQEKDVQVPIGDKLTTYWTILKKIWNQCFNVCFGLLVTIAAFPAVVAFVQSTGSLSFLGSYFTLIVCFLNFNIASVIGTCLPNLLKFPGPRYFWILVVLRALLIPFFLMCNYRGEVGPDVPLIQNDLAYLIAIFIFGLTNGYCQALSIIYAVDEVPNEEKSYAGMLAAFFLILGVLLGSFLSNILSPIVLAREVN